MAESTIMDIKLFLEQTNGQWFSQCTTYDLTKIESNVENSKADLAIDILPSDDPKVTNLSQQYNINSQTILGVMISNWNNAPDWGKPKQQGSSMLIIAMNKDDSATGEIFRLVNKPEQKIIKGKYILGKDEALTLILEEGNYCTEERIWFASTNLRMRTTIHKYHNQCFQTSFYSEIKKVTTK